MVSVPWVMTTPSQRSSPVHTARAMVCHSSAWMLELSRLSRSRASTRNRSFRAGKAASSSAAPAWGVRPLGPFREAMVPPVASRRTRFMQTSSSRPPDTAGNFV